jgi:hypothetical protein
MTLRALALFATAWDVASFGSFCNCVDCEDVANYMTMDFDRELYRTMILRTGLALR